MKRKSRPRIEDLWRGIEGTEERLEGLIGAGDGKVSNYPP